jgi:hypothetical protein
LQLVKLGGEFSTGDGISHEASIAGDILPSQHNGLTYGWMLFERPFDLTEFDAIAANFDLGIETTQKLDVTIRQITG